MFDKFIDDIKESTGTAVRKTSAALAMGVFLFLMIAFLCAAAFVYILDRYGLIQACLSGAGVFFAAALVAAICYAAGGHRHRLEKKPVQPPKSPIQTALSDPMVMATALQAVRVIGVKRLVPILAIGGVALGLLARRNSAPDDTV